MKYFLILFLTTVEVYSGGVRTIDECYGQAMRAICPVGFMVRVTGAFYRQAITCPGSFHSNYCMREEPGNPACTGNQTCVFTSPWVHLSQECGYSNNFLLHYECIRKKDHKNICSTRTITDREGYITTPNYPKKYPVSRECLSTITAPPGAKILIYLLDIYLAYFNYHSDKQCIDQLQIQDRHNRTGSLCSGRQRGLVFESSAGRVDLNFTSTHHKFRNAKGFWLFYRVVDDSQTAATTPPLLPPTEPVQETTETTMPTRAPTTTTTSTTITTTTMPPTTTTVTSSTAATTTTIKTTNTPEMKTRTSKKSKLKPVFLKPIRPKQNISKNEKSHENKINIIHINKENKRIKEKVQTTLQPTIKKHSSNTETISVSTTANAPLVVERETTVIDNSTDAVPLNKFYAEGGMSDDLAVAKDSGPSGPEIGAAVGGVIICLVILSAVVSLLILWKRRKELKDPEEDEEEDPSDNYDDIILAYNQSPYYSPHACENINFEPEEPRPGPSQIQHMMGEEETVFTQDDEEYYQEPTPVIPDVPPKITSSRDDYDVKSLYATVNKEKKQKDKAALLGRKTKSLDNLMQRSKRKIRRRDCEMGTITLTMSLESIEDDSDEFDDGDLEFEEGDLDLTDLNQSCMNIYDIYESGDMNDMDCQNAANNYDVYGDSDPIYETPATLREDDFYDEFDDGPEVINL